MSVLPSSIRPTPVRVARNLLLATAVVLLVDTFLTMAMAGAINASLAEMYAPTWGDPDRHPPGTLWPCVGTTLPGGLGLAFSYAVTALGVHRGWSWPRHALALAALPVACCSSMATAGFFLAPIDGDLTGAVIRAAKFETPLWIERAWEIDGLLHLAFILTATILVWQRSAIEFGRAQRSSALTEPS